MSAVTTIHRDHSLHGDRQGRIREFDELDGGAVDLKEQRLEIRFGQAGTVTFIEALDVIEN